MDDSDIKIFTPASHADKDNDILDLVESIDHHRRNGNVARARKLGKNLVKVALQENVMDGFSGPEFRTPEVTTEIGVLLLFSTEAALNYFLPTAQLSAIAISSLHEAMESQESEFFKNVVESPAYSLYYLSIRKGGEDVARSIGESFAKLCQHPDSETFIAEGKRIYELAVNEVEKDVLEAGFKD